MNAWTTPTQKINVCSRGETPDFQTAARVWIDYRQFGQKILTKEKGDMVFEENKITVRFSQEETGKFIPGSVPVWGMINAVWPDGTRMVTKKFSFLVDENFTDGVVMP